MKMRWAIPITQHSSILPPASRQNQGKWRVAMASRDADWRCLSESRQLDYGGRRRLSADDSEEPMPHKFKVGDIVALTGRFAPGGVFEVVKQLPGGSEPEYHIKSVNELHQRVARESELIKA
jgi:hypothetical protein